MFQDCEEIEVPEIGFTWPECCEAGLGDQESGQSTAEDGAAAAPKVDKNEDQAPVPLVRIVVVDGPGTTEVGGGENENDEYEGGSMLAEDGSAQEDEIGEYDDENKEHEHESVQAEDGSREDGSHEGECEEEEEEDTAPSKYVSTGIISAT